MGAIASMFLLPGPISWVHADITMVNGTPCYVNRGGDAGVIVFAHGNCSCLGQMKEVLDMMADATKSIVIAVQYPGYGRSGGKRRPGRCIRAITSVLEHARELQPTGPLTVIGHSVGTAFVTQAVLSLKESVRVDCLVLISAFTSLETMAPGCGIFFRTRFARPYQLDTRAAVEELASSADPVYVYVIHGDEDEIIPISHADEIFQASAAGHRFMLTLEGDDHNSMRWDVMIDRLVDHIYRP